jgi:drug/metabolite transporter (DMT)-like permease
MHLSIPWYAFVLLSSALFAMNNLIEKYVVDKHIENPMTLMIVGCFLSGLIGSILFIFFPVLRHVSP